MLQIVILTNFGLMYFRHIENSVEKYILRNRKSLLQSLFSATTIFKLKIEFFFYKNWIDSGVCYIKSILNEDGTFMTVLHRNTTLTQITLHILDVYRLSKATYIKPHLQWRKINRPI